MQHTIAPKHQYNGLDLVIGVGVTLYELVYLVLFMGLTLFAFCLMGLSVIALRTGLEMCYHDVYYDLREIATENARFARYSPARDLEVLFAKIDLTLLAKLQWSWLIREVKLYQHLITEHNLQAHPIPHEMIVRLAKIIVSVQQIMLVEPVAGFDYRPYLDALEAWRADYDALLAGCEDNDYLS